MDNNQEDMTASSPPPCYGDEATSDVIFLVGREDDQWRLPAHKAFLACQNPVFRAMFSRNFASVKDEEGRQLVQVPDIEARCYDNLLRFLYNEPVPLQSLETTIGTWQGADKYLCPKLAEICLSDLHDRVNCDNVLLIFKVVRFYCDSVTSHEPTAPPSLYLSEAYNPETATSDQSHGNPQLLNQLYQKCLSLIDQNAMTVLTREDVEDLDIKAIQEILDRPTLNAGELFVFSVLQRWTEKECKRRHLPLTPSTKWSLLSDAAYSCRYLTLTPAEFSGSEGPFQSGLLPHSFLLACQHALDLKNTQLESLVSKSLSKSGGNKSTSGGCSLDCHMVNTLIELIEPEFPPEAKQHIATMLTPRSPAPPAGMKRSSSRKSMLGSGPTTWGDKMRKWFMCQAADGKMSPTSSPVHAMKYVVKNGMSSASPLRTSPAGSPYRRQKSKTDQAINRAIDCWVFFFD